MRASGDETHDRASKSHTKESSHMELACHLESRSRSLSRLESLLHAKVSRSSAATIERPAQIVSRPSSSSSNYNCKLATCERRSAMRSMAEPRTGEPSRSEASPAPKEIGCLDKQQRSRMGLPLESRAPNEQWAQTGRRRVNRLERAR